MSKQLTTKKEKSEKKALIIALIFMAIAWTAGFFIGRLAKRAENLEAVKDGLEILKKALITASPYILLFVNVTLILLTLAFFWQAKKLQKEYENNPDDEFLFDRLEQKLNQPIFTSNLLLISNFFLFSAMVWVIEFTEYGGNYENLFYALTMILFVLAFIIMIIINSAVLQIEKSLNPEKRGSIFDLNFNKVWEASCDEAQKAIMYQAGYMAYKTVNVTCMILWIVAFVSLCSFHTGLLPILCICIIWLVATMTYMKIAAKLERGSR